MHWKAGTLTAGKRSESSRAAPIQRGFEHARLSELPEEIAFAVIHHHNPPKDDSRVARLTRLGYMADLLADVVRTKEFVIESHIDVAEGRSGRANAGTGGSDGHPSGRVS